LEEERLPGGYHDHVLFRKVLRDRLLDALEDELRIASGLVDESRYSELFERYVTHVNYWLKGEKLRNPITGAYEDPDQRLMQEIETVLGAADQPDEMRRGLINSIAAWVIDHPDQPIDHARIFASQHKRLRESVFAERRGAVAKLGRDLVLLLREEGSGLDAQRRAAATRTLAELKQRFGYEDASVADAAGVLLSERFAALLD
jgi:predicted Ser/Thr protein kinase